MTIKVSLAALALTLLPMMSLAGGGCAGGEHQTQSCVSGSVWDADQQTCIKQVTG